MVGAVSGCVVRAFGIAMGYDLHITRRKHWADLDSGDDISREEFESYVRSDAEFTYPSQMGEDYAEWKRPKTSYQSWLCWQNGQIQTKNPEAEFIDKMVAIAKHFKAVAQGDDGEVYLSATEVRRDTLTPAETAPAKPSKALPIWLVLLVIAIVLLLKHWIFDR